MGISTGDDKTGILEECVIGDESARGLMLVRG